MGVVVMHIREQLFLRAFQITVKALTPRLVFYAQSASQASFRKFGGFVWAWRFYQVQGSDK
jgi:hypothetical protein